MNEELKKKIQGKEEIWLPVVGYEGLYEVSNRGSVYSIKTDKVLLPSKRRPSIKCRAERKSEAPVYFFVSLSKNGKSKKYQIHRLVAIAFIPNPENKPYVNHINEITTDNRVQNLEWSTCGENTKYSKTLRRKEEIKRQNVLGLDSNGNMILPFPEFLLKKTDYLKV